MQRPDQPAQPSEQERAKAWLLWQDLVDVLLDQYEEVGGSMEEEAESLSLPKDRDLLVSLALRVDPVWAIQRFLDRNPPFDLENLRNNNQYRLAQPILLALAQD